jgi:hypothetical protein
MQGDIENLGHIVGALVVSLALLPILVSLVMRRPAQQPTDELAARPMDAESSRQA